MENRVAVKQLILSLETEHLDSIGDDDQLIELGVIDSLGILKLVCAIEEKFSIKILDEELIPENFQTIHDISALIETKQRT